MRYSSIVTCMILSFWILISGCSVHNPQSNQKDGSDSKPSTHTYHLVQLDECAPVELTPNLVKKVDNFMVMFDPSASMTETYVASDECITCHVQYKDIEYASRHSVDRGGPEISEEDAPLTSKCQSCHLDYSYTKFKFAKKIAYCFNQTIPDLKLISALRTFGSPVYTMISHGPESYSKEEFGHNLRGILDADGTSPLDHSLKAAKKDWFSVEGKTAVIIISDGKDMDERPVLAAEELKAAYEENICIYTIHVGNDITGKLTLEKIA
ncbi:MAG: vWA domain-containing protein, partial [Thermodesulfobacteriota bacterium]|nr:vWA domain-containing protein [Thermodesulfobacteriota bacterium]